MRRPLTTFLAIGLVAACGEDPASRASAGAVTVRDSSGVTIVENRDSVWTAETRWRLADEPDLVIGSVDGSVPGTDWGQVGDVLTVGDRIVVEASRVDEIRIFDAESGGYLRTVGGSGDGPTEFRLVTRIGRLGDDRIGVVEGNTGKVVEFTLDGSALPEVWTTGNPDMEGYFAGTVAGWTTGGDLLLRFRPTISLLESEVGLLDARWRRASRDGTQSRDLAPLPAQRFWRKPGGYQGIVTPGANATWQVAGTTLWHAFPERWELTAVDLEAGAVDRIVRLDVPPRPTPEAWIDAIREFMDEQARAAPPEIRASVRRNVEEQVWAETLPAFRTFLVSPDGHIWVNAEPDPSADGGLAEGESPIEVAGRVSPDWTVLDPDGRWLGTITVPAGFEVREVGVDHVLGVREDEFDVPFLERYRVLTPR